MVASSRLLLPRRRQWRPLAGFLRLSSFLSAKESKIDMKFDMLITCQEQLLEVSCTFLYIRAYTYMLGQVLRQDNMSPRGLCGVGDSLGES